MQNKENSNLKLNPNQGAETLELLSIRQIEGPVVKSMKRVKPGKPEEEKPKLFSAATKSPVVKPPHLSPKKIMPAGTMTHSNAQAEPPRSQIQMVEVQEDLVVVGQEPASTPWSPNLDEDRPLRAGTKLLLAQSLDAKLASRSATISDEAEYKRSVSKAHLIDYFTDEVTNNKNREVIKNKYFYYGSEVHFSVSQYLEMMFHHLLYFACLGPFVLLGGIFNKRLKYLHSNLQFYKLNKFGIFQNLNYVLAMSVYFGYFWNSTDKDSSIDSCLLKTILLSLVLMTTSIAGKYATYPRILIKKYKESYIGEESFNSELMLGGWKSQNVQIRRLETDNAVERLEIDEAIFLMAFMARPSEENDTKLRQAWDEQLNLFQEKKKLINEHELHGKVMRFYHCRFLFELLLTEFNKVSKQRSCGRITYAISVSLVWAFSGLVLRVVLEEKYLIGTNWFDSVVFIMVSLVSMILFFAKFMFYLQAVEDLERRTYMMNQCGFLVSPLRIKKHYYDKVFPTINILDKTSLNAWFHFRRLAIDYGRKYFYRHELFLPVALMISIFCLMIFGILLYLRYKYQAFNTNYHNIYRLMWQLCIDSFIFGFMAFHFMYDSGAINAEFREHMLLLKNNRAILCDLLECKNYYFSESIGSQKEDYDLDLKKLAEATSESFLHERLKEEVMTLLGPNIKTNLQPFLRTVIETYDSLIARLGDEEEQFSIQILGMVVTRTSVLNLLIASVSVILTAWQLFFGI